MSELNLMVHCGGNRVEREQVMNITAPKGTETHHPIAHSSLITMVESALSQIGLKVLQEAHAVSHENMRYFGMMEVVSADAEKEYNTVLGLRNSNDKIFPAGFVVGSGVFVCDNLCFSGEVNFGRKHTKNIMSELPELIMASLKQVGATQAFQDKRIEAYKTTEFTDSQAHDLLFEAFDAGVIPAEKLGKVREQWKTPKHPEFKHDGKTAWRLMNAFTEILKPRQKGYDLFRLPGRGMALHNVLDSACGLMEEKPALLN